ncbi:glycosyltransferase family 4 protein, partial [Candidatus Shapirobacteria bacterium]|nr:glycosyltransferase family 4 protein [Candidatus Shapirobacteria bacterium]
FFGRLHNQTIGRLALSAEVVLCVSKYEKSLIESSGVKVKRIEVLPNGVDTTRYKSGYKSLALNKKSEALAHRGPTVVYVGRVAEHKGVETLIKAAPLVLEKVPEAKFVIAGPDENAKCKMQNAKFEKKLIFTGEVSEEEKVALMQRAGVFVLPSQSEAFGITVIEAMAAGCPVVVSAIPSLMEIVKDGQTGLVFPVDDEKVLASQIIRVLADQNLSRQLSTNAKVRVEKKYSWEKIIDHLERTYASIL